jgi:prepilin-type processing-associated H-X9-DG protein
VDRYSSNHYDGAFERDPTPAAFSDGLATIAFVSERVAGNFQPHSADVVRNIKIPHDMPIPRDMTEQQFIDYCVGDPGVDWVVTSGRYWMYSGFVYTLYNHSGLPNDRRPTCSSGILRDLGPGGLSPPRSYHPGGVNVLLGDGHVRRVADGIAPRVWSAMGTRSGGD